MSGTGAVIPTALALPPNRFEVLIGELGQRIAWMKSHSCPCVYGSASTLGSLPTPGSAQRSCKQCGGLGTYWEPPSLPFRGLISFIHTNRSPDEPGTIMDDAFGQAQMSEPTLTIPFLNPFLALDDPAQPMQAWADFGTDDIAIAVDMLARFTAVLEVGGQTNLPFQQNLQIAARGAVTVWNPVTQMVDKVDNYTVSGPTVTVGGYPDGTAYMVEFHAAPLYVAFRRAGGLPHIRPFGGGVVNEPRRFQLNTLDFWTRQRGIQPTAAGSSALAGTMFSTATGIGSGLVITK